VEVTELARGAAVVVYRVTVLPARPSSSAVEDGVGRPARVPTADPTEDSRVGVFIIIVGVFITCYRRWCKVGTTSSPTAKDFRDVDKP
jgi:hypothetical protein